MVRGPKGQPGMYARGQVLQQRRPLGRWMLQGCWLSQLHQARHALVCLHSGRHSATAVLCWQQLVSGRRVWHTRQRPTPVHTLLLPEPRKSEGTCPVLDLQPQRCSI